MHVLVMLASVVGFPVGCLGLLLWLAHLEDTLPQGVRRSARRPSPPPILAIPVQRAGPSDATVLPLPLPPARPAAPPDPAAAAPEPAPEPASQPARTVPPTPEPSSA